MRDGESSRNSCVLRQLEHKVRDTSVVDCGGNACDAKGREEGRRGEYINSKKEKKRQEERDEDRSSGASKDGEEGRSRRKIEEENDRGETTRTYGRSSISILSSTC